MTFKTEQFDSMFATLTSLGLPASMNNELDVKSTVQMIMQYPNNTEEIVRFIACKIKHFAEFEVKMEMLKKEYDQSVMELYAHYMKEWEDLDPKKE